MTKTAKIEQYKRELEIKKKRLTSYLDMEEKMLNGSAQSYSLGSRSKSNYNMSLNEIGSAIKKLEDEIRELEGLISGVQSRKVVSVIPRF